MIRAALFFFLVSSAAAQPRSGSEFASDEIRRLQASDIENPAMLWIDRGAKLWEENCTRCHGEVSSMRGVSARYAKVVKGKIVGLEEKIREKIPLDYESDDLLGLTAYVAMQSRGMAVTPQATEQQLAQGKAEYYRRRGQMNLSCAHCHEANWGKHLGAE